jgi:hypothetical protein
MHMTDRGLLALARHEGIVPAPYLDVKRIWTFGVGHTAAAGAPDPGRLPRGMPADLDAGIREAMRLFRADLTRYEAEVARALIEQPFATTLGRFVITRIPLDVWHRGFLYIQTHAVRRTTGVKQNTPGWSAR